MPGPLESNPVWFQLYVKGIDRAALTAELGAATETEKVLCDAACMARVDSLPETVTPSGLKFRDIAVGKGPTPPTGYQARPQGCRLSRLGTQCSGAGALA